MSQDVKIEPSRITLISLAPTKAQEQSQEPRKGPTPPCPYPPELPRQKIIRMGHFSNHRDSNCGQGNGFALHCESLTLSHNFLITPWGACECRNLMFIKRSKNAGGKSLFWVWNVTEAAKHMSNMEKALGFIVGRIQPGTLLGMPLPSVEHSQIWFQQI